MKKTILFALSLVAAMFTWAQTSPYTGSEAAAGNFYIYNVESGYWLQNNNRVGDWNSQVQVDAQGFDWELIDRGNGTWQLNPKFGNNHSLNSGDANGYLDTGQGISDWTLTPVEGVSNGYTIESNGTKLGVNGSKLLVKDGSAGTVWQLVTAEERLEKQAAQYASVSGENPMDISWMIPGANFNIADEHADALVKTAPNAEAPFVTGQTNSPGNGAREIWYNKGAYDIGYKLTGLPDGVYRFTFSGFYRDGNAAGIGAKHQNGTEVIRPELYINEKTQPVMSTCAPELTTSSKGCNFNSSGIYVPNSLGDAAQATAAGYYVNKAIKVIITDGVIDLGVRASEGADGTEDWMIFDYFKLVYYGPDNIESSIAMLNSAIETAEAWDASSTSTAMKTALDDAIAAAKEKLTSADSDEVEAAAEAVNSALAAAKSIDVTPLKALVVLAQAEGIDVTAANEVITNATNTSVITAAVNGLMAARKIKALGGAADIYTGSVPAAGEFYFYNLGTGMWLNQGSDWCTHAAVDQAGLLVTFEESGDGFIFRTPWGTFNNSPYTDTQGNTVYKFQAVEGKENVYNILEGSDLLGYNPDGKTDGKKYWSSISNVAGADPEDPNYQWKIVSKAERDALVAAATKDAPVDATYLINNPSLQRQPGYDMWKMEVDGGNGGARVSSQDDGNGDRAADFGWEYYDTNSFKFYQELEGLAPGIYEVSATAFYRDGNGGYQAGVYNDGGELLQLAYLFANDEKTPLPNIASVLDKVPGVATQGTKDGSFVNWPREAFEYFETGYYKTTVKVLVGEDGKLSLGIAKDSKANGGDWVVLDNFRLTYLGNDEAEAGYMRALKAIENGAVYRIYAELEGQKLYLNANGQFVSDAADAAGFEMTAVQAGGTLYATGWNLGCKFTNPTLTDGSTGDVVQNGGINLGGNNDRNDWERQVFFLDAEGKYAVRSTNANSSNWGANTYWDVVEFNELPAAGYALTSSYVWNLEYICNAEDYAARKAAADIVATWIPTIQSAKGLVTDGAQYTSNAKDPSEGSYEALVDGVYESFFHSTWHASNDPQADHYLQAELSGVTQEFYFYFKKRSQNNNNRPSTIVVSGSNDGEEFTEITTISEGLPTGATPIDYLSAKISADVAYKYIRFTVPTTNTGNKTGDHVFFTFSEFYILPAIPEAVAALDIVGTPTYMLDAEQVKTVDAALKAALNTVKVTYALYEADGTEPIQEKVIVQEGGSEVKVPAEFTNIAYYDYTVEGAIADEDCTIKITRAYKEGLVLALDELSNAKAYTITCDRGALLTKDDYLASTGHNSLVDAAASNFAIISYEDNYYLYSVADKKFVTNSGALADIPTNGVEDAIKMDPKTAPYFMYYFVINGTNNGLNTNGNDPYGYVINTWMTADAGNQYFMIATADFDATEALALLEKGEYLLPLNADLAANEPNPVLAGDGLFQKPQAAYDTFKAVYDAQKAVAENKDATIADLQAARTALSAAVETYAAVELNKPEEGQQYVFQNKVNGGYLSLNTEEGQVFAATDAQCFVFTETENGYFLGNELGFIGIDGSNVIVTTDENKALLIAAPKELTEDGVLYYTLHNNVEGGRYLNGNRNIDKKVTLITTAGDQALWSIVKYEVPEALELALNVERYPGMGYSTTEAEVNLDQAKAFLGVDELTTDMLRIVNPDGEEISDYAPFDGWFNAEGVATTWGDNTAINVKFFQAIPDGAYTICDMNGADEVGKTYSVKWALSANDKKVIYTINVTFVEKPAPVITNLSGVKVADTQTIELTSELGKCYEALSSDVDIASILSTLGVESISDLAIFAVGSDGTLDDNYKLGTTDGWRNASGDWQSWGDAAYFYVKADFTRESAQVYEVGGMEGKNTTSEWENPASYTASYVFVNLKSDDLAGVVLKVTLSYSVPVGINGLGADLSKATIYDLNGRKLNKVQKGGVYIVNGKKITIK